MTLRDCLERGYDISLYLDDDMLWYWDINGGYHTIGGSKGYYNPNTTKLELINFLNDWNGFD